MTAIDFLAGTVAAPPNTAAAVANVRAAYLEQIPMRMARVNRRDLRGAVPTGRLPAFYIGIASLRPDGMKPWPSDLSVSAAFNDRVLDGASWADAAAITAAEYGDRVKFEVSPDGGGEDPRGVPQLVAIETLRFYTDAVLDRLSQEWLPPDALGYRDRLRSIGVDLSDDEIRYQWALLNGASQTQAEEISSKGPNMTPRTDALHASTLALRGASPAAAMSTVTRGAPASGTLGAASAATTALPVTEIATGAGIGVVLGGVLGYFLGGSVGGAALGAGLAGVAGGGVAYALAK